MELIKEAVWFWAQKAQKWHFIKIKTETFKSVLALTFDMRPGPLDLVIVRLPHFICWPSLAGTAVWDNSNDHWSSLQEIFWTIIIFSSRFPWSVFTKTNIRGLGYSLWVYTTAQNCPLKISLGGHGKPFSHVCQHLKKISMRLHETAKWQDDNISCFWGWCFPWWKWWGWCCQKLWLNWRAGTWCCYGWWWCRRWW